MITWAERIKSRMKELGLTQEELAQQIGITRGAITHYLSGRRVPPLKQFQKLADALKTNPAWLQFGLTTTDKETKNENSKTNAKPNIESKYFQIPILTLEQISKQSDTSRIQSINIKEWVHDTYTQLNNLFALRVKGDSMISITGQKSFYDNDIIIVNPSLKPMNGDFIVATIPNNKEVIFKQFIVDGGIKYLKSLNSQYPMIGLDRKLVCRGVVIRCITELKNP